MKTSIKTVCKIDSESKKATCIDVDGGRILNHTLTEYTEAEYLNLKKQKDIKEVKYLSGVKVLENFLFGNTGKKINIKAFFIVFTLLMIPLTSALVWMHTANFSVLTNDIDDQITFWSLIMLSSMFFALLQSTMYITHGTTSLITFYSAPHFFIPLFLFLSFYKLTNITWAIIIVMILTSLWEVMESLVERTTENIILRNFAEEGRMNRIFDLIFHASAVAVGVLLVL